MTCNMTIYRADVHAGTTADTTEHRPEGLITQDIITAIVYNDNMGFTRAICFFWASRTSNHGEVVGNLGANGRTNKHFHHDVEGLKVRNDTFCTNEDNLCLRNGGCHTAITFVRNDSTCTSFRYSKVTTIYTNIGLKETFPYQTTYEVSHFFWVFCPCVT